MPKAQFAWWRWCLAIFGAFYNICYHVLHNILRMRSNSVVDVVHTWIKGLMCALLALSVLSVSAQAVTQQASNAITATTALTQAWQREAADTNAHNVSDGASDTASLSTPPLPESAQVALAQAKQISQMAAQIKTQNNQAATSDPQALILDAPVVDAAHIFSDEQKQQLTEQLLRIYESGLAQMAIVTIASTGQLDIFDYSAALYERWQLGSKQLDNGLLIVIAVNDRKIRILTGYGLEGALPDAAVRRIIREEIEPLFRQQRYAQGLNQAINTMEQRLRSDPETLAYADAQWQAAESESTPLDVLPFLITGFVAANILGSFFGRILSASIAAAAMGAISFALGLGWVLTAFVVIAVLVIALIFMRSSGSNIGYRSGGSGGSFGGGSFGGGGFGGYSGGGGSFGGGGAGGSW